MSRTNEKYEELLCPLKPSERRISVGMDDLFFYCLKCETPVVEDRVGVCPECDTDHFYSGDAKKLCLILNNKEDPMYGFLVTRQNNLEFLKLLFLKHELNLLLNEVSIENSNSADLFNDCFGRMEADQSCVKRALKMLDISFKNAVQRRKTKVALFSALDGVKKFKDNKKKISKFWIHVLWEEH